MDHSKEKGSDHEGRLARYAPMSPAQMNRLHEDALRLLEEVGIQVDHDPMLDLVEAAGADADRSSRVIRLPSELVEESLGEASRRGLLAAQSPDSDMELRVGGPLYGRTVGGPEYVLDALTGER